MESENREYYPPKGYDDRYYEQYPPQPNYYYPKESVIRGTETDRNTSKCLYVGNLPYGFREEEVMDMLGKCGPITSVVVPQDKYTGRNKGFAFVTFEVRMDAEKAKEEYK